MTILKQLALSYYVALNLLLFMLFCYDKFQSRRAGDRIPERSLLILGFIGGMAGGLLGMKLCRHKTRKHYFAVCYILALLLHIAAFLGLLYLRHKGGAL